MIDTVTMYSKELQKVEENTVNMSVDFVSQKYFGKEGGLTPCSFVSHSLLHGGRQLKMDSLYVPLTP